MPWYSTRSLHRLTFSQTIRNSHPLSQPTVHTGLLHRLALALLSQPTRSPRSPHPKASHQRPPGAAKIIQTMQDLRKVLSRYPDLPQTPTVTSCWRPVLERVTVTQIMLSCTKNCPRSRQACWNLWDASTKSNRCKRLTQSISMLFINQNSSSSRLTRSNLQSSPMMRQPGRK